MTSKIESKLGMYDSVRQLCEANSPAIAALASLQTAYDDFKSTHDEIRILLEAESAPSKQKTALKVQARLKMETETLRIAGALLAFAEENDLADLRELADIPKSSLMRATDEEISILCKRILQGVNIHLASLSNDGIDATRVSAFSALIDDYESQLQGPKLAINLRSAAKEELKQLMKTCDGLLKNRLDTRVDLIEDSNLHFFLQYNSARKVYANPTHETTLRALVKDKEGKPVEKVVVSIPELDSFIMTDEEGIAVFKPIPNGIYDLRADKEGFKPAFFTEAKTSLGKSITFLIIIESAA